MSNKFLLVIAGPTAVGKTALAIELAKYFHTEIISADSRQLYKEMSIGTAKPSLDEMKGIKHHLLDCISVKENYNAGNFEKDALDILHALYETHKVAILCGGTGLYINAVCNGFDEGLQNDRRIKGEIKSEYAEKGIEWLQNEIKEKDSAYFESADIHNPQRMMRALEVIRTSGKPYSSLRKNIRAERDFTPVKIFVNEERDLLYGRINKRTDKMMEDGLLDEAKRLYSLRQLNALNTVGYKELFDHLDGKISLEKAVELIKQHSRNYAKRQITWFKNDGNYTEFKPTDTEKIKSFTEVIMKHV